MDILNAKQAFEAMSSGQAVLCRAVGQLLDFGELSQFPATVFFGADYEFCLAPRFMTIGQLDLEVPECIQGADDLINSAMYYAPNLLDVNRPIEILSTTDNATYLKRLIASKLLHKTADDAIAHARAFITLNGGSLDPIEVEAVAEPKPTPTIVIGTPDDYFACIESKIYKTKSPEDIQKISDEINADPKLNDDDRKDLFKIMDAFHATEEVSDLVPTKIVEKKPIKKRTRKAKEPVVEAEPTPKSNPAFTVEDVDAIETDANAIIEKFTTQIANCTTTDAVLSLRPIFLANGHLERKQHQYLCKLTEDKLLELDPETYTPQSNIEIASQENVTVSEDKPNEDFSLSGDEEKSRISAEIKQDLTYKIFQMSAEELDAITTEIHNNPKLIFTHKNHLDGHIELRRKALAKEANAEAEREYQTKLTDLINRASQAQSPAEANALVRYTNKWSAEQRQPLLQAIHKRLSELSVDAQPIEQPPSLMVQIQNAPDLTTLDALEIDVGSRHPDIQPKLMGYIRARRFELENGPSGDAQQ
ncbi:MULTISPECIES: hypothetical protein [Acinetobacter]|uniref:Uncharacterized protein n=1 Tax=Acinetobacter piscicola TaxID=2006115 RepID=A0A7S6VVM9_9GAMM|nr:MULTISPECIES: hypothetical protein [Acinetobacter]QOW45743.1 hypothetical protein G0028_07465 [Acinetobacter piscicola]